ncbi:hypothetical protein BSKO_13547 [Bryopsis sp. KO-2023]|nr:hypothetical protein BSKO_13547 [Bryopsis sp. KO-2023]
MKRRNGSQPCSLLYAIMGDPPGGKNDQTFSRTLLCLLGLALAGAMLNLSNPFKSHTITLIISPGEQNARSLSSEEAGLDAAVGFEGVDLTASGHSLLAQVPDKKVQKEVDNLSAKQIPPLMGLVTTHHKTGTALFSTLLSTLCSLSGVDFQKVAGVIPLGNSTFDRVVEYSAAKNSDGRIAISMHGFKESCFAEHECDRFDAECRLSSCKLLDNGDEVQSYGIVHVVRNPLEMLISAYLYHREMGSALIKKGFELWLLKDKSHLLPEHMRERFKGVPYFKVLQELSVTEGIRAEFLVNGGQIFRAARNYRDLKNRGGAINIRFEDLQNKYQKTMKRVFEKIDISKNVPMEALLEVASNYDVQSMPREVLSEKVGIHMTEGKFDKTVLRKVLYDDHELRNAMNSLAKEMGYDSPFEKITPQLMQS